jgi:hypothetical protein
MILLNAGLRRDVVLIDPDLGTACCMTPIAHSWISFLTWMGKYNYYLNHRSHHGDYGQTTNVKGI